MHSELLLVIPLTMEFPQLPPCVPTCQGSPSAFQGEMIIHNLLKSTCRECIYAILIRNVKNLRYANWTPVLFIFETYFKTTILCVILYFDELSFMK